MPLPVSSGFAAPRVFMPCIPMPRPGDAHGRMPDQPLWINGGYFVLRSAFSLHAGRRQLVSSRLRAIGERKTEGLRWEGFWQ